MNSQASSSSTLTPDASSPSASTTDSHRPVAPGFRFHPTEQELVLYYLGRKVFGEPLYTDVIPDFDVYKFEPHEVPGKVGGDIEWYFFSKLDKKYETGERVNRSTEKGFWKVTGPEYKIRYGSRVIGEKRFLVYYNRNPKMARRTDWVMHEYRLMDATVQASQARDTYALYKLFWKGTSNPIPNGPVPVTADEGKRVHDNIASADAAHEPSEEFGPHEKNMEIILAPEVAPAAYTLVFRREAKIKTLDLLANFNGEGPCEHVKQTSFEWDDPMRPAKRPRNAEADSPQKLAPITQEPSSSSSMAVAIPSLKLSLACLASEIAPKQQQQPPQIAALQHVPQQPVEPPQATSIRTSPNTRLTIVWETVNPEPSKDQNAKDI